VAAMLAPWNMWLFQIVKKWEYEPCGICCRFGLKVFYMLELAYYLIGILAVGASLIAPRYAWEIRRKDSLVMLTHHVATSALLSYSYLHG
jgi:hypothetical protein